MRLAVASIVDAAAASVARRAAFHLVIAGGTTPQPVYRALRAAPTDWRAWHVYFGDERCLPPGDAQSNSAQAAAAWLDHVPLPAAQRHAIDCGAGARPAAIDYARVLRSLGDNPFDLVLLGLGEDGHTASLFPGDEWGCTADSPDVLPVYAAPKPPAQRVTLSAARLSRARQVLFLVRGESKRQALLAWQRGEYLPAAAIRPPGSVDVLVAGALFDAVAQPDHAVPDQGAMQ